MGKDTGFLKVDILNEADEIILASTKVTYEGNRLILSGDNFAVMDHKTMVKAVGYLQDGIVTMIGIITLSTESQFNLDITDFDEKKERRAFVKVQVNLPVIILRAYGTKNGTRSLRIDADALIRDMSVGGIGLCSEKVFFKNQVLLIDLGMIEPGFLAQAVILRKERGGTSCGYRYKYGCKFINMNSERERVTCEYVFRAEIEKNKRRR